MEKYYIVDSTILPDVLDKVIEARSLLQNGRNRENRCAREFVRCMKNARCGY